MVFSKEIANTVVNGVNQLETNYAGEVYVADNGSGNPSATVWQTWAAVDDDGPRGSYNDPYHQSTTSLMDKNGNSVNADTIPYIVIPGNNNNNNVMLGDVGILINTTNGNNVGVIYANGGNVGSIGEASVATHAALGFNYYANGTLLGHDTTDLKYIMFPGTGASHGWGPGGTIPTAAQIGIFCLSPRKGILMEIGMHFLSKIRLQINFSITSTF